MVTQTIENTNKAYINDINSKVKDLMSKHEVSYKTGFLAEEPLRFLPGDSPPQAGSPLAKNSKRQEDFIKLDKIAHSIETLIKEKKITESVNKLQVPEWSFDDLPWPIVNRLMLVIAMITHAYFREKLQYKDVGELMKDASNKSLPPQLAVPLWKLSRINGIAPSMSYGLYSLWNYYKKNPELPITLDNIDMIHSFTGTLDEKWFVWIHQVVEVTYAKAIPELLKAYLLSISISKDKNLIINELINSLGITAEVTRNCVNVLERMREHCDYKTYFDKVRLFYAFPRCVVFEGVEELGGKPQEIFGETGGQSPFMHLTLATLGVSHGDDPYFPSMQKHMLEKFRTLIQTVKEESKLYNFVDAHKSNRKLVRRYNMLVQSVLDWRAEHRSLVDDYIKVFGEIHGTGKPPLEWLKSLYDKTKTYLIDY